MEAPRLVGRREELAALESALSDAVEGRPQLVLLSGEAGLGKTRLLDELSLRAQAAHAWVLRGRAHEGLSPSFQPFAQVVRDLLRVAPEALERLLGTEVGRLRDLVRGERAAAAPPSDERPHEQLMLYSAITRATCELARVRPCVLVVDDVHWADGPSLDQLQHLVFATADAASDEPLRLLIVAGFRNPKPEDPLARVLSRLDREPIARSVTLGELGEDATGDLIEAAVGCEPTRQLIGDVRAISGGNPLFVQATIAGLLERGAISVRAGYASLSREVDQLDLPRDLDSAVGEPAQGVSDRCRALLIFAAACGDEFDPRELADLIQLPDEDLVALVEEGRRAGLVTWEGETFRFRHPLVRQSLYHIPGPLERQRVHLEIAARLEKRSEPPGAHERLSIAHHLVRAPSLCPPERLADAAERAAEVSFSEGAWRAAARLFGSAARGLERAGGDESRVGRLHFWAGFAHYRDMDVGPATEEYDRALEMLREADDAAPLAQVLVERTRTRLTTGEGAFSGNADTAPLVEALHRLGDREPERRGQLCHMLAEVCWTGGDPDQAVEWAERGAEIARATDDPILASQCLTSLGMARSNQLRLDDARRCLEEALAEAERSGDRWTQGQPLQRLPLVLAWLGRLAEAERFARAGCAVTRETQDWAEHSLGLATLTLLSVARGRREDAERQAADAFSTARRAHYPWGALLALAAVASARAHIGDAEGALRALDKISGPDGAFTDAGPALTFLTTVYRQLIASQGGAAPDGPLAIRLLADSPNLQPDIQVLGALCAGVETARNLGDAQLAARCYEPIAAAAERGVLLPSGWVFLVPRILGVAAAQNAWWERAEDHFAAAAAAAAAVAAEPELALTCLDHAVMRLSRSAEGDREQATELLERADTIAQGLGLEAVVDRIASVASVADVRLRREGHWRGQDPRKQDPQTGTVGPVDRVLLVSDMEGFTTLFERFGDEEAEAIVDRHNVILRACLREYGGREVQHTGDGVIASFTSVDRTLACAGSIQRDLVAYNEANPERPIRVRVGVHRGRTTPVEDRLIGAAVNATVRIANVAASGEIYLSDRVREAADDERFAFADRGDHSLKGFSSPLRLFELLWEDRP